MDLHRLSKRSRETDSEDEANDSSTQRVAGNFAKSADCKNSSASEADSATTSDVPSRSRMSQDRRKHKRPVCPVLGLPEGWNLKVVNEARTQVRIRINIKVFSFNGDLFSQADIGSRRYNDFSAYLNRQDSGSQYDNSARRIASRRDSVSDNNDIFRLEIVILSFTEDEHPRGACKGQEH